MFLAASVEIRFVNHNYRPQTKFAKVMFSHVSVCPQGVSAQGMADTPPPAVPPRIRGRPPLGRHPQDQRQTPPATGPQSGQYASHWNTFLLGCSIHRYSKMKFTWLEMSYISFFQALFCRHYQNKINHLLRRELQDVLSYSTNDHLFGTTKGPFKTLLTL